MLPIDLLAASFDEYVPRSANQIGHLEEWGAPLIPATLAQQRRLTNGGAKMDLSYVKATHYARVGVQFSHTFLREFFRTGLTDPTFQRCL